MAKTDPILMYDLAGVQDTFRISPFCWRIRMALAHKKLAVEAIPWRMVEKDRIIQSNSITVPVIVDDGKVISDSWAIAEYLDQAYPANPLFDSSQARAYCLWIHHWTERIFHPLIVPIILEEVLSILHPGDLEYFRSTREAAYGKPLEQIFDRSPSAFARLSEALAPMRRIFRHGAFLAGAAPAYGDYVVFGAFQWARCCSSAALFHGSGDPMIGWFERMLDLFGGLGRSAATPFEGQQRISNSTGTGAK